MSKIKYLITLTILCVVSFVFALIFNGIFEDMYILSAHTIIILSIIIPIFYSILLSIYVKEKNGLFAFVIIPLIIVIFPLMMEYVFIMDIDGASRFWNEKPDKAMLHLLMHLYAIGVTIVNIIYVIFITKKLSLPWNKGKHKNFLMGY